VIPTLRGTELAKLHSPPNSRLTVRMYSRSEYYRPEHYRRLGLAAKQRAAQSTDPRVKEAFQDVARHWLALAERVEWLDTQLKRAQAEKNP
jgi:hypothetical protein